MRLLCWPAAADEIADGERRRSCLGDRVQGILDKFRSLFKKRRVVATDHDHELVPSDDETFPVDPNPRNVQAPRDDHIVGGSCKMEGNMVNGTYSEAQTSKERGSVSSLKVPSTVIVNGVEYYIPSSEDEDVCPTCLEEYTEENPKITAYCSHHFHLGCIYEWMERSQTCPICGRLMQFDE